MAFDDGVKTVSGSIAHTDDAATKVPFVSVKCGIEPTLTGKSEVVCTQTGKNILNGEDAVKTANNIRFYYTNGKYYHAGTYTLSISESVSGIYVRNVSTSANIFVKYNTNFITFTLTEQTLIGFDFYKVGINQDDNVMLEVGSTASTFEPYSSAVSTASLGRTIYGGTADVVDGTGTDGYTNIIFDGSESEWQYQTSSDKKRVLIGLSNARASIGSFVGNYIEALSSAQGYPPEWKAWINANSQLVIGVPSTITSRADWQAYLAQNNLIVSYEKATPSTFTFTPITPTPETVGKFNNVYCDTGDTELTYYDNAHGFSEVTVTRCGKNLFNVNQIIGNGYFDMNGVWRPNTSYKAYSFRCNPSMTFTNKGNFAGIVTYWGISGNFLSAINKGSGSVKTFTTPENCYEFRLSIPIANLDGTQMVEIGESASAYEAYSGVSKTAYLHKVIFGGTADVVKGTCEPKNLVDFLSNIEPTYSGFTITVTSDYGINFSGTGTRTWAHLTKTIPCDFDAGTKLVFSIQEDKDYNIYVLFTYEDSSTKQFTIESIRVMDSVAFTLAKKAVSVRLDVALLQASTEYNETLYCMIEKGTTKTDFAPYFAPFTFPPISMETDEGENTLFATEGDSSITYRKAVD